MPSRLLATVSSSERAPLPYPAMTTEMPEDRDVGLHAKMARPTPNSTGVKPMRMNTKPQSEVMHRMVNRPMNQTLTFLSACFSSLVSSVNPKIRKMMAMFIVDTTFQCACPACMRGVRDHVNGWVASLQACAPCMAMQG